MKEITRHVLLLFAELQNRINVDEKLLLEIDKKYSNDKKGNIEKLKDVDYQRYCMRKFTLNEVNDKLLKIVEEDLKKDVKGNV